MRLPLRSIVFLSLGLLSLAVGLRYLLVQPSALIAGPLDAADLAVVLQYRWILGQTAVIAGVVFCATAWQPRS